MAALRTVPMFGSGVFGKSFVVTRQRRVNCYYEIRKDGDKSKVVIYGTPGLLKAGSLTGPSSGPARGLLSGAGTQLYAVVSNQFQSLNSSFAPTFTGNIATSVGQVEMATNPASNQQVVVDGNAGYVYTGGVLLTLTAAWFQAGAKTVTNVAGYFVTEYPNSPSFGVSNINDATAGSALSFGTPSDFPDLMVAVDNLDGNLLTFGAKHLQFWQNVGTPPPAQPFASIQSATQLIGLAAIFSRAKVDSGLIFLGQTLQGTKRVYQIKGYSVNPISEEIDAIINAAGFTVSDAVALTYQRDVHPFYQLTFPTMGRSFLFDCSSGIWSEAMTGIPSGFTQRHAANLSVLYAGDTILSDAVNNNLYRMSDTTYTDNGVTIVREVVTRHTTKQFNRFRVPQLYLDMETGVGLSGDDSTSGVVPKVSVEVSKDNGRTWFPARILGLGRQGDFMVRVNARRFGQARVMTFRFRCTDPVKFVITEGEIVVKGRLAA